MVGFAGLLGDRFVLGNWNDVFVRFIAIGVEGCLLTIHRWDSGP
jgi:hypothetical protein